MDALLLHENSVQPEPQGPITLCDDYLHRMYEAYIARQKSAAGDSEPFGIDITFDQYKGFVQDELKELAEIIFTIIPQYPEAMKKFCEEIKFSQSAGIEYRDLRNACILDETPFDQELFPKPKQDITIGSLEYLYDQESFKLDGADLFALQEAATRSCFLSLSVQDWKKLSEDEQDILLRSMHPLTKFPEEWTKKMVFGLHIPKDLQQYDDHRIEMLQRKILTDPDFAEKVTYFFNTWQRRDGDHDAHTYAKFEHHFMTALKEIWQIPNVVKEDYDEEPHTDKSGKKFQSAAHAFSRASRQEGRKVDFIYGVNRLANSHFTPRDHAKFLVHEFGHLVEKAMILTAQSVQDAPDASGQFSDTIQSRALRIGRFLNANSEKNYFHPLYTDFDGLEGLPGHHPYSGQLRERHAISFANKLMSAVQATLYRLECFKYPQKILGDPDILFRQNSSMIESYNMKQNIYFIAFKKLQKLPNEDFVQKEKKIRSIIFAMFKELETNNCPNYEKNSFLNILDDMKKMAGWMQEATVSHLRSAPVGLDKDI